MLRERQVPSGVVAERDLRRALNSFAASTVRLSSVDSITTEIVRMRCATYHDCRL